MWWIHLSLSVVILLFPCVRRKSENIRNCSLSHFYKHLVNINFQQFNRTRCCPGFLFINFPYVSRNLKTDVCSFPSSLHPCKSDINAKKRVKLLFLRSFLPASIRYSFIHAFIQSVIHPLIHSSIYPSIHPSINPTIYPSTDPLTKCSFLQCALVLLSGSSKRTV
jgi:hypothetical protein